MEKIITPISKEYINLIKENSDIENIKYYISKYAQEIISEKNKEDIYINKNDFNKITDKVRRLKLLKPELKEIFGKEFDFKLTNKLIWNLERFQFSKLINDENFLNLLGFGSEDNFFFLFNKLEDITLKGIIKLIKNDEIFNFIGDLDIDKFNILDSFYNIRTMQDFEKIAIDKNINNLMLEGNKDILKILIKNFNIKNSYDFDKIIKNENILYLLRYGKIKNLNKVIKLYNIVTLEELENICKNDFIILMIIKYSEKQIEEHFTFSNNNEYKYGEGNEKHIFEILKKYRDNEAIMENGQSSKTNGPFNVINTEVEVNIDNPEIGKSVEENDIRYFSINDERVHDNRTIITKEVQLIVNRIFSPIMPMARLIELSNQDEKQIMSIDVENCDIGINASKYKDDTPEEILLFMRMLYQFITVDFDRFFIGKSNNHNITNKQIIYDFNEMYNFNTDVKEFKGIFNKNTNLEEYGKILYSVKNYIFNEVIQFKKLYKGNKDIIEVLSKIGNMINELNFTNLVNLYNLDGNSNILKYSKKIDNIKYFQKNK